MTNSAGGDQRFSDAIAQLYEQYLVPLIFEPYARDLACRLVPLQASSVLELAAGTGAVTRQMADLLPAATTIVATDLNPPMLEQAMRIGTSRPISWRQADAMDLPFDDKRFDAVVCQFGAMFFPDQPSAFAEARRVLRPGGRLLFSVWDRIEDNEFADCVTQAMAQLFPADPPGFLTRLPHGHHDRRVIADALAQAGFTRPPAFDTVALHSRADSARTVATAFCQGTPLRTEIEARDPAGLSRATEFAAAALARRFGTGPVSGRIQAIVVTARREPP